MVKTSNIMQSVMVLLMTITLFACEGNYKTVQKFIASDNLPSRVGENVKLVYTDSGKVVSNLITPKLLDYSNLDFGYEEFPDGVEVQFFEKGDKSVITADYAMRFPGTEIVDLRQNVVVVLAGGEMLTGEQLYWDQKNKWVFTDEPYRITFADGSYNDGAGFDANEDFTVFLSRANDGMQIVNKTDKELDNGL